MCRPAWHKITEQTAERDRVSHVAEHLERLAGQPRRLGEAPGRQRERGSALQEVPSPERAAEPVQAGTEVGELTLDAPQLTGLEQGVDPPQPAPHLDPGAAQRVGGLQHPGRQHGPLGQALGGAAGQLPGPQRVDERGRVARRFGGGQRVPANQTPPGRTRRGTPAPARIAADTRARRSSGRSFPARACSQMRQISPSHSGTPVASITRAARASPSRSRRRSARRPTPAAACCDPGRSPLRCRAAARASSSRSLSASPSSPSPTDSACRYRRTASSNASASAATSAAASHAATARRPVAGQRRLDPVPGDLRQVQAQLPLVQRLDRVRRRRVQPPLLLRAQPGGHRRTDQRVREAVIAGMVTGHHESGGPALVQRTEQAEHRHAQHPGHHAGREAVARHRGGPQQRLGRLRHLGEPVGRRVNHPSRHRHLARGGRCSASIRASSRTRNGLPPVSACTLSTCSA